MSGGSWEDVMGVLGDSNGKGISGLCNIYNSGYVGLYGYPSSTDCDNTITSNTNGKEFPNNKYYKIYNGTNWYKNPDYLGEALGETRSWYGDFEYFVSDSYPWFVRGGRYNHGDTSGLYHFYIGSGRSYSYVSFRSIVISG